MNYGKGEAEKGPEKAEEKNKDDVNEEAHQERKIPVMSGHRGNPVNQESIEGGTSQKAQEENLLRSRSGNDEKKRDKGYPG